jgi:hypothetical protein
MIVPKPHCAMQCFHGKRTSNAFCAIILGCKYQLNAEPIEGVYMKGENVRFTQPVYAQNPKECTTYRLKKPAQ